MKKLMIAVALAAFTSAAFAGTAFFKHERVSGMNKICVYDHLGSDVAITISSVALCPLTLEV